MVTDRAPFGEWREFASFQCTCGLESHVEMTTMKTAMQRMWWRIVWTPGSAMLPRSCGWRKPCDTVSQSHCCRRHFQSTWRSLVPDHGEVAIVTACPKKHLKSLPGASEAEEKHRVYEQTRCSRSKRTALEIWIGKQNGFGMGKVRVVQSLILKTRCFRLKPRVFDKFLKMQSFQQYTWALDVQGSCLASWYSCPLS